MRLFGITLAALLIVGTVSAEPHNGTGREVMLQGFHWFTYNHPSGWYNVVRQNAPVIQQAGFDCVWFPPPSASAAKDNGYLPTQWYDLNNGYGSEAQLMNAIAALKPQTFAICDLVLNHRCGERTAGPDFEDPSFGGDAENARAVVRSDECGQGTGEDEQTHENGMRCDSYKFGRDLNHHSGNVQAGASEFLEKLARLGFEGWRYDMVRGYHGFHVGDYNDRAGARLSVGEFADPDRQVIVDWIDETRGRSMAFDFPTRYTLQKALGNGDYAQLKTVDGKAPGVIGLWPEMAVTFVENHDCQPGHEEVGTAFPPAHMMQAYAYILTHPGVPCVFWSNFFDSGAEQKDKLRKLIQLRKSAGLHSGSALYIEPDTNGKYAATVDDKVAVKLGPASWSPGPGWKVVVDGPDYAVWRRK